MSKMYICPKCGSKIFSDFAPSTLTHYACGSIESHGTFTQSTLCLYQSGAQTMTRIYETPNKFIMAWLKIMKMGAMVMPSGRVHYKYPKDHPDNTLFRDLEELATVIQHRDVKFYVIKYLWEWRKGYFQNTYEIKAKAQAEIWLKKKPADMEDDTYLKKVCKENNIVLTT